MRRSLLALLVLLACFLPISPAMALERGPFEAGPFIGYNRFDSGLTGKAGWGAGVRAGYFFLEEWEAELELLYARANGGEKVSLFGINPGVLYHPGYFATPRLSPYLVAGAGSAIFDYDNPEKSGLERDWSLHFGAGAKYLLKDNLALRGDIRQHVTHGPARQNLLASVGISWSFDAGKKELAAEPVPEAKPEPAPVAKAEPPPAPPPPPATPPPPPAPVVAKIVDGDEDGDGVANSLDKCPFTPRGVKVDASGCPVAEPPKKVIEMPEVAKAMEPAKQPEPPKPPAPVVAKAPEAAPTPPPVKKPVRQEFTVLFAVDSSKVGKEYEDEAAKIAQILSANPSARITIEGHADDTGATGYNQRLSERRARSLARILTETHKIPTSRITTVGYGETRPADSNKTEEGRAKNRRAVALITTE